MQYDNFNYDAQGAHDAVYTAKYDFTNVINAKLKFDVAYTPYGGQYSDTLEVLASTDCGATFTSLYKKGGVALSTAPPNSTTAFVPTSSQWRTDSIDVSLVAGFPEVLFSFVNIGYFGQVLYVDNINLGGTFTGVNEPLNDFTFSIYPNPVENELTVSLPLTISNLPAKEKVQIRMLDVHGKIISSTFCTSASCKIRTAALAAGTYFIEVTSGNRSVKKKFIKE